MGQHCEVESAHVRQCCEVEWCPEEGSAMRGGMPMQARGSIGAVLMRRVPMRGSGDEKCTHVGQCCEVEGCPKEGQCHEEEGCLCRPGGP